MPKNLMIVESPEKAKKITKFLGDDWEVVASVGHIQHMTSDGELGFDKETLQIKYVLDENGKILRARVGKKINSFERIVIATDPDREGEAIAKHVIDLLRLGNNYERLTFNEITKDAVINAVNTGIRPLDMNLIAAQESRRIIDRYVGWEHTSALTSYLGELSPVGRVQSQFVKIIVDREKEVATFQPTPHWSVTAYLGDGDEGSWHAEVDIRKSGVATEVYGGHVCWTDKQAAESLSESIATLEVVKSSKQETKHSAPMPFKTSTLQQSALRQLGLSSSNTDKIAQSLYMDGHITYIRTDSTELSDEGFRMITEYANQNNLPVLSKKRVGKKGVVSQEAHECIRPTDFNFTGEGLGEVERAMYHMIWVRAIASQLEPAVRMKTTTVMKCEVDGREYIFNASGSTPVSEGWRVLLSEDVTEEKSDEQKTAEKSEAKNPVPILEEGDVLQVKRSKLVSKTTSPPPFYTEASLNGLCEKQGISRPSTFSSIVERIIGHKYIVRNKPKSGDEELELRPTKKAFRLVDSIGDSFKIMDIQFTRKMEDELDLIANGQMQHNRFCKDFFEVVDSEVLEMAKKPGANQDNPCEKCGGAMIRMPNRRKDSYWWLCPKNSCNHKAHEVEGRPATLAEMEEVREQRRLKAEKELAPFLNEDGSPKYPCPNNDCGHALKRIPSKKSPGKYFWGCTAPMSNNCGYRAYDDPDKEEPVHDTKAFFEKKREEEKLEYSDENGLPLYPCPKCGSHVLPRKGANGVFWACCTGKEACGFTAPNGSDDKPILDVEQQKKEKLKEISNADGSPKWPCKGCGGHLIKRPSSTGGFWFGCMNFPDCKAHYPAGKDGNPNYNPTKNSQGRGKRSKPRPKKQSGY